MKPILLIDFGSTYTKLTAVDVEGERILGTAQSYTTVETDINDGLRNGLALLEQKTGKLEFAETIVDIRLDGGVRLGCAEDLLPFHIHSSQLGVCTAKVN